MAAVERLSILDEDDEAIVESRLSLLLPGVTDGDRVDVALLVLLAPPGVIEGDTDMGAWEATAVGDGDDVAAPPKLLMPPTL